MTILKKDLVNKANAILSAVSEEEFESIAKQVSHAIWSGDQEKLNSLGGVIKPQKPKLLKNSRLVMKLETAVIIILAQLFIMKRSFIGVLIA